MDELKTDEVNKETSKEAKLEDIDAFFRTIDKEKEKKKKRLEEKKQSKEKPKKGKSKLMVDPLYQELHARLNLSDDDGWKSCDDEDKEIIDEEEAKKEEMEKEKEKKKKPALPVYHKWCPENTKAILNISDVKPKEKSFVPYVPGSRLVVIDLNNFEEFPELGTKGPVKPRQAPETQPKSNIYVPKKTSYISTTRPPPDRFTDISEKRNAGYGNFYSSGSNNVQISRNWDTDKDDNPDQKYGDGGEKWDNFKRDKSEHINNRPDPKYDDRNINFAEKWDNFKRDKSENMNNRPDPKYDDRNNNIAEKWDNFKRDKSEQMNNKSGSKYDDNVSKRGFGNWNNKGFDNGSSGGFNGFNRGSDKFNNRGFSNSSGGFSNYVRNAEPANFHNDKSNVFKTRQDDYQSKN
ncbi:hypothetical protein A3Q56_06208 [Intoshia linei]|uniref:Uncharacterized protein n=1 Tax=Intoshia linei TaxID=1819745 RepID=A0A177AY19_9BILA|nr:hypothetical protein A3Q56_06208 [Intoshia linei]